MTKLRHKIYRSLSAIFCAALLYDLTLDIYKPAYADEPLSTEQREVIEAVIYDYLMKNPDVILKAFATLREREQRAAQARLQQRLKNVSDALYNDPLSPEIGNPDASVTIVEFFDYRCGYCKRVFPVIKELLNTDKDIRLVFKEYPILGKDSVMASRASLAIWMNWPDKYLRFHTALITSRGSITQTKINEYAAAAGIDIDSLKQAMRAEKIDKAISITAQLAQSLGIDGTPGFIIGNELIPGAIDIDTMRGLIIQARKKK